MTQEQIREELPDQVYAAEADWVKVAMKEMTARRMVGWLNAYAEYETTAGNDTTAEHARHMADRLQSEVEPDVSV
jgi:hypothetical protein